MGVVDDGCEGRSGFGVNREGLTLSSVILVGWSDDQIYGFNGPIPQY